MENVKAYSDTARKMRELATDQGKSVADWLASLVDAQYFQRYGEISSPIEERSRELHQDDTDIDQPTNHIGFPG